MNLLDLLDRPIAFHRPLVGITGSVTAALMLSQAIYWSRRTKGDAAWFYKTQSEWEEETGLNRGEQELARKSLRSRGILEEKKQGVPCRMFYRLNEDVLRGLLLGNTISPGVARTIAIFKTTLKGISRTAMRRAEKLGVRSEFVSYEEVLRRDNGMCHICGCEIERGPGKKEEFLQFDHVVSLDSGGEHVLGNVRCAHAGCNLSKGNKPTQSSMRNSSKLEWPTSADQPAELPRPSNISETTAETTTKEREEALSLEPAEPVKTHKPKAGTVNGSKPSQDTIETFCQSIGLPRQDGEIMLLKWNADGWPKNWQDKIRYWKRCGYMPSQKVGANSTPHTRITESTPARYKEFIADHPSELYRRYANWDDTKVPNLQWVRGEFYAWNKSGVYQE